MSKDVVDLLVPTRRQRVREATINEILDVARVHLSEVGAAALSLRSIARDLGMTASALYRYFASRDDLITALITEGFGSLADAVIAADAKVARDEFKGRFIAATCVYRSWSIDHPAEHSLLFSSRIPGYEKHHDATGVQFCRGVNVLFEIIGDALQAGKLELSRLNTELTPKLRKQIVKWKKDDAIALPEAALLGCLLCWTQMLGAISAEMYCHLPKSMNNSDAIFVQQMTNVFARIGIID